MPDEVTESYDGRTRVMTCRVAVLAVAIPVDQVGLLLRKLRGYRAASLLFALGALLLGLAHACPRCALPPW